jgi:hypothetical protein
MQELPIAPAAIRISISAGLSAPATLAPSCDGNAVMHPHQDTRAESAIYWSAVSLIVCEGLSVGAAAERLGIENARLRNILRRRRRRFADLSGVTNPRHSSLP